MNYMHRVCQDRTVEHDAADSEPVAVPTVFMYIKFIDANLYTHPFVKLQESFKVTDIDKQNRAHYS